MTLIVESHVKTVAAKCCKGGCWVGIVQGGDEQGFRWQHEHGMHQWFTTHTCASMRYAMIKNYYDTPRPVGLRYRSHYGTIPYIINNTSSSIQYLPTYVCIELYARNDAIGTIRCHTIHHINIVQLQYLPYLKHTYILATRWVYLTF